MKNSKKIFLILSLFTVSILISCSNSKGVAKKTKNKVYQKGEASWYGPGFNGKLTANGEKFNQNKLTAAHKKLPFGTRVKVTNLNNGKSIIVRINDRGPFVKGRIIDLSKEAAKRIDMIKAGHVPVKIYILK